MQIPIFFGEIIAGKLQFVPSERNKLDLYLGALTGKVMVKIEKFKKIRSTGRASDKGNQNGLYWLYLKIIEEETGNFADDLHEYFKRKFLTPRELNVLNDKMKIPGSTAKLNTLEFSDYLEKIQVLTNIPIPDIYDY